MLKTRPITLKHLYFNIALRELISKTGISQSDLARRVGVASPHINRILLRPTQWGSEETRRKIIQVLTPGKNLDEFIKLGKRLAEQITDFSGMPEQIVSCIKNLQNGLQGIQDDFNEMQNQEAFNPDKAELYLPSDEVRKYLEYLIKKADTRDLMHIYNEIKKMYYNYKALEKPTLIPLERIPVLIHHEIISLDEAGNMYIQRLDTDPYDIG